MHVRSLPLFLLFSFVLLKLILFPALADNSSNAKNNLYTIGEASPGGIGKFYMGREISKVMGHLGAGWLERLSVFSRNAPIC